MYWKTILTALVSLLLIPSVALGDAIIISQKQALKIGVKIWYNEAAGKIDGLTSWGKGEDFASLGIGHFVWHHDPKKRGGHVEDFPRLLKYLDAQGVNLPRWLKGPGVPLCPWSSREAFYEAQNSRKMLELRLFLLETIPLQAQFIAQRLNRVLPQLLERVTPDKREQIRQRFYQLELTPKGLFALVDYVNFKGEGGGHNPIYHYQGWGLLEVLEEMGYAPTSLKPLEAFVWSADRVLTRRVQNAPFGSPDGRWLAGWRNRVYGYL